MSYLFPLTKKFEGGRFVRVVIYDEHEMVNAIEKALCLLRTTRVARRDSVFIETMPASFNERIIRFVNNNSDKGYQYHPKMYVSCLIIETNFSMQDVRRGMVGVLKNVLDVKPIGPCIILNGSGE